MQPTNSHSLRAFSGLIGLSLLIHGGFFYSADRVSLFYETEFVKGVQKSGSLHQKKEKLEFEFVEAPAKISPVEPNRQTRKISNRNAVNQDLQKNKSSATNLSSPMIPSVGKTNQLAQIKNAQAPVASRPTESGQETQKQEEKKVKVQFAEPKKAPPQISGKTVLEQKPVYGLTGEDKITTQAMTRVQSRGAKLYGVTSFEATGSGMGEYMKNLKEKIWFEWFPYISFKYPSDFYSSDTLVSMTLNSEGEIIILRMLESNGNTVFDAFCMEAIQRASGFGKLPQEILALVGKDTLEIQFGFHYH